MNNMPLLKRVLTYVSQNKKIKLDKTIMRSQAGFTRLAREGLIEINEIDNEHFATLTDKGLQALND
ncbi:MAG: hypothetical protein WKF66_02095 [Pedobacter sp.]